MQKKSKRYVAGTQNVLEDIFRTSVREKCSLLKKHVPLEEKLAIFSISEKDIIIHLWEKGQIAQNEEQNRTETKFALVGSSLYFLDYTT